MPVATVLAILATAGQLLPELAALVPIVQKLISGEGVLQQDVDKLEAIAKALDGLVEQKEAALASAQAQGEVALAKAEAGA